MYNVRVSTVSVIDSHAAQGTHERTQHSQNMRSGSAIELSALSSARRVILVCLPPPAKTDTTRRDATRQSIEKRANEM